MSDTTDSTVAAAVEADIEAEVERRVQAELAKAAAARVEAERAAGYVSPVPGVTDAANLPSWYPVPEPVEEDQTRRVFPRGTSVSEVIEYDRQQSLKRAEAEGGAPKPLPMGTVTATAAEFLGR